MGLSCGMSLIKYLLFIFNLLCAVSWLNFELCGEIKSDAIFFGFFFHTFRRENMYTIHTISKLCMIVDRFSQLRVSKNI